MAKLADVMTKKSGKLLLTRDLTGKAVLITEDLTADTDIRETEDKKYMVIQVKVDCEVRDWNPTAPQLKAVVEALGKPPNLKGKVFQVTGSVKDGYKSKTTVIDLRGDYAPEAQTRITSTIPTRTTNAPQPGQGTGLSDLSVFLGAINAQPGGHVAGDAALDDLALLVCGGDATEANFMKGVAKSAGRIKNEAGCWSVTK